MPYSFFGNLLGGLFGNAMNMMNQGYINDMNWNVAKLTNLTQHNIAEQTNLANREMVRETNLANLQAVNSTNLQQKELQYESWRREDNAVQRRAQDLSAAGINPILAAGGAAQASGPIQLNTPRHEAPQDRHMANLQLARMEAVRFETDLLERAMRMRDDFATNAKTRQLLEATAKEHLARATQIGTETRFSEESFDLRIKQLSSMIEYQGAQKALLSVQRESETLRQQGIIDSNHGIVLDNVRKVIQNEFARSHELNRISNEAAEYSARLIANDLAKHESEIYKLLGITRTGGFNEKAVQAVASRIGVIEQTQLFQQLRKLFGGK